MSLKNPKKKITPEKQILLKVDQAADLLYEANQIAVKHGLESHKSKTCYLCEIIETVLENMK